MFQKEITPKTIKESLLNAKRIPLSNGYGFKVKTEKNKKLGYILYDDMKSTLTFSFKKSWYFDDEIGKLSIRNDGIDIYRIEKFQVRYKYRKCGIAYLLIKVMVDMLQQQSGISLITYPNSAGDYDDPRLAPYDLYKAYHRQGFRFEDKLIEECFLNGNNENGIFDKSEHKMILSLK